MKRVTCTTLHSPLLSPSWRCRRNRWLLQFYAWTKTLRSSLYGSKKNYIFFANFKASAVPLAKIALQFISINLKDHLTANDSWASIPTSLFFVVIKFLTTSGIQTVDTLGPFELFFWFFSILPTPNVDLSISNITVPPTVNFSVSRSLPISTFQSQHRPI